MKLFFNLRKAKSHIGAIEEGDLTPAHTAKLADRLGVTEKKVTDMNRRLAGPDSSLNKALLRLGIWKMSGRTGWLDDRAGSGKRGWPSARSWATAMTS